MKKASSYPPTGQSDLFPDGQPKFVPEGQPEFFPEGQPCTAPHNQISRCHGDAAEYSGTERQTLPPLHAAIAAWLARGKELDETVRHYVETTMGDATEASLRTLLDPTHPDHEAFAELVLYPDAALHAATDAILHAHACPALSPNGETRLTLALQTQSPNVCAIRLSQSAAGPERLPLTIPVSPYLLKILVQRLHLTRVLPADLAKALHSRLSPDAARVMRIRLRTGHLSLSPRRAAMLCLFWERYPTSDPLYAETTDFWLHFLSTLPDVPNTPGKPHTPGLPAVREVSGKRDEPGNMATEKAPEALRRSGELDARDKPDKSGTAEKTHPLSILRTRHARLMRAVRQSGEFAEAMRRYSMDLLMMQGALAPFIDTETARTQLHIMERLALALFGEPLDNGDQPREADYGTFLLGTATPETPTGARSEAAGPDANKTTGKDAVMDEVLRTLGLIDR